MNLHDVVERLTGPIQPIGETNADAARFENLCSLIALVDHLLYQISLVAELKDRHEHSVKRAGKHADDFLVAVAATLNR